MRISKKSAIIAGGAVFALSVAFFCKVNVADGLTALWIDEERLGEICVSQVMSGAAVSSSSLGSTGQEGGASDGGSQNNSDGASSSGGSTSGSGSTGDTTNLDSDGQESADDIEVTGDPQVIIYHTHSTESYMPYNESNYHRTAEEGTVRDVGNVMTAELKKLGINVVHDTTIHDRPSYNESYSRSLSTIQSLMKKYPTAKYIIDLHRDAAAASATEGKSVTIDGIKVAKYSLVVGRRNENYVELYAFAKKINQTAESMYSGFGGTIIEKQYNYNEFVSNNAILLEVGNNKNTIEETRRTAKLFARVLAQVISN